MRPWISLLLSFLLTGDVKAQPQKINIRHLRDYYVTDQSKIKPGVNFFVLTNRADMDKMFGTTTRPDTPDFRREWMLLMVLPESKKESRLSFDRISMKAGNFLEVYCTVKRNLYPITYKTNAIAAGVIPIYPSVERVMFYNQDGTQLMQAVELKTTR